jgi:hypothetical protein
LHGLSLQAPAGSSLLEEESDNFGKPVSHLRAAIIEAVGELRMEVRKPGRGVKSVVAPGVNHRCDLSGS